MKLQNNIIILFIIFLIPLSGQSKNLMPENIEIESDYMPGFGPPVGKVKIVQGKVYIIHLNILKAYIAKPDLQLYKGDKIVCMDKSRARLVLSDASLMTIGSNSVLILNKILHDPLKQSRASFINMERGKARFGVRKLSKFRRSNFKVKTPTALVGVRGSDFVIKATDTMTEVTTFKDTQLEVLSLAAIDIKATLLEEFEKTIIELGEVPSEIEKVPFEEIEDLKHELSFDMHEINISPEYKQEKSIDSDQELKNDSDHEVDHENIQTKDHFEKQNDNNEDDQIKHDQIKHDEKDHEYKDENYQEDYHSKINQDDDFIKKDSENEQHEIIHDQNQFDHTDFKEPEFSNDEIFISDNKVIIPDKIDYDLSREFDIVDNINYDQGLINKDIDSELYDEIIESKIQDLRELPKFPNTP